MTKQQAMENLQKLLDTAEFCKPDAENNCREEIRIAVDCIRECLGLETEELFEEAVAKIG